MDILNFLSLRRFAAVFVVALASVFLMACSDDERVVKKEEEPVDGSYQLEELEEFVSDLTEQFVETYCGVIFGDCPDKGKLQYWNSSASQARSLEECLASPAVPAMLGLRVADWLEPLDNGRVLFDNTKAQTCLDDVAAAILADACWAPNYDSIPSCAGVFGGRVGNDRPCLRDAECATGYCKPFDDECYGTCHPRFLVAQGHDCDGVVRTCDVRQGHYCEPDPGDEENRICVAAGSRQADDACISHAACAAGLVCDSGVCTELSFSQLDEPCNDWHPIQPCVTGLTCASTSEDGSGTCKQLATAFESCATTGCAIDHWCWAGVCEPAREAGEGCQEDHECAGGLKCGDGAQHVNRVCQIRNPTLNCELPEVDDDVDPPDAGFDDSGHQPDVSNDVSIDPDVIQDVGHASDVWDAGDGE